MQYKEREMLRTGLIGLLACLLLVSTAYSVNAQPKRDRRNGKQVTQPPPEQESSQVTQPPQEQGPTLKETMDWLTTALTDHAGFFVDITHPSKLMRPEQPSASSNACVLSYRVVLFMCPCRWVPAHERDSGFGDSWMVRNVQTDREMWLRWDKANGIYRQDQINIDLTQIDPVSIKTVQTNDTPELWTVKFESSSRRTAIDVVRVENSFTFKQFDDANRGITPQLASIGERTEGHGPAIDPQFRGFQEREMAKRVEAAFKHAVKLCGGKASPF
jgi:hypothetical protein